MRFTPVVRRLVTAVAALLAAALTLTGPARADGPEPIRVLPGGGEDHVTVLMGGAARRADGIGVVGAGEGPKNFWLYGLTGPSRWLEWSISVAQAGEYHVSALLAGQKGRAFRLTSGGDTLDLTTERGGFDRVEGTIRLPKGTSTLRFAPQADGDNTDFKALELFPADHYAAYQRRVDAFRAAGAPTREKFSKAGYGLMFQFGPWGYPEHGSRPSLEEFASGFDVKRFADMVQSTGAGYVTWSMTWWTYQLAAPSTAVDAILGNGDRTAARDLVGDVATELKSRGIQFYLYYHTGQDSHLGLNSTDWWRAQSFPDEFSTTGGGDRQTFFRNWKSVIGELGARYGDRLDGWFFDDGLIYYPAPFEELGKAARTGNPNRLVSYNTAGMPRFTEFQDMAFGEGCGSAPKTDANGIVTEGPDKGMFAQCMFTLEDDWGVWHADQTITTRYSGGSLAAMVRRAKANGTALSINMMMWYPGTPAPASLKALADMKAALEQPEPVGMRNDDDPDLVYEGSWERASGRAGAGDYLEDVTYTRTDGDSVSMTFTGTGIDVLGPVDGQVLADVYLDGTLVGRFDQTGPYRPQVVLYGVRDLPRGSHTVELVKRGGPYLQIDAVNLVS
ncbi:alpha-L-fucosidase [Microtetraspora malaysiensis]|uniref:alpha-L-fucosidase n=1 Tax=Microtetraspora malaysiensis TaxID=161358 RepID=UPI003D910885